MVNWKNRRFIKVISTEGTVVIAPIKNFTRRNDTQISRIHSLEKSGSGIAIGNTEYALTLNVSSLRDAETGQNPTAVLERLQETHEAFKIVNIERPIAAGETDEYAYETVLYDECYVQNMVETMQVGPQEPMATFNVVALKKELDGTQYSGEVIA
jgi:hypothetical protein